MVNALRFANVAVCRAVSNPAWCRISEKYHVFVHVRFLLSPLSRPVVVLIYVIRQSNHCYRQLSECLDSTISECLVTN